MDFLIHSKVWGVVGIQRKELSDLVASVRDGRLQKELAQMKALPLAAFLIEGKEQWTNDGLAMWSSSWTRSQHLGTLWGIQSRGFWLAYSQDLTQTIAWLSAFEKWLAKERHVSLAVRPGQRASSVWGTSASEDYALHFLQGIPGVGIDIAKKIYDRFGVPIAWTITDLDLQQIPGIGQKKAAAIISALKSADPSSVVAYALSQE